MVSRKKARGQARRAAKDNKANGSLEAQMQRLTVADCLFSAQQCRHGLELLESHVKKRCEDFFHTFFIGFVDNGENKVESCFNEGIKATGESDIWEDAAKLKQVVRYCVAVGAQLVLGENDLRNASIHASLAYYFEQYIATHLEKTKSSMDLPKLCEMIKFKSDSRTLLSFFRKRIPCKCLDEKYKEFKSVIKTRCCCNSKCSLPGSKVERNKTLYCSRCNQVCYCSRECQKADWKEHKEYCRAVAERKAVFDSEA